MNNNKSKFQRSALFFSAFSIIASLACAIYLYLKIGNLGWEDPISASLLASSFFFGFVAFILFIIGTADIPNLKIASHSD